MPQIATAEEERVRIGRWIRERREALGLSTSEFALYKLGMRDATLVEKWERGRTMPSGRGRTMPSGRYFWRLVELLGPPPKDPSRVPARSRRTERYITLPDTGDVLALQRPRLELVAA